MPEPVWDLVVVGTGPAGSAAAIGALSVDPTASVLLLDRSDFPRDKCCGDAVVDAAFDALQRHGVARDRLIDGYLPSDRLQLTSPRGVTVSRRTPSPMTVIPRSVFDARLRTAAVAAGAVWRRRNVRTVHATATGVEIDGELRARIVIGADGVESVVRRAIFPPKPRRLAVAIRGYQADVDGHPPTMVLDDRKGLAYAWYFPTRTGPANVGYGHLLTDDQPVTRHSLLTRMHQLLPWAELDPSALRAHRLPLSSAWQPAARGRILLVGDAASLVNPISGEGIYYAIASGLAAGAASVTTPQHAATRYTTALRHQFGRHQRHVALLAAMIRSPAVLEAGVRAAKLRQRVFEDIYALGLVDGPLTPQLVAGIIAELATHSRRPAAAHAYGV